MDNYQHLRVNAEDLAEALDSRLQDGTWLLDLETGAVALELFGEIDGEPVDEAWEESGRYLAIDPIPSHEAFGFMEDFWRSCPMGRPPGRWNGRFGCQSRSGPFRQPWRTSRRSRRNGSSSTTPGSWRLRRSGWKTTGRGQPSPSKPDHRPGHLVR